MKLCYLSGGVGGAKLLHGLDRLAQQDDDLQLTAIVNTGDDFEHWGLQICPDLDTVMYTLAEQADFGRGWGLADETYHVLAAMREYGADDWFLLGDRDLATHILRTQRLKEGVSLTQVTHQLCRAWSIHSTVLPMSDLRYGTVVETEFGRMPFQDWLVKERARIAAKSIYFEGDAQTTPQVVAALKSADAIVIGPSNPYVSIHPILSLPGVRDVLASKAVLAVSPIVGGHAIKGPLAAMLNNLDGLDASAGSALSRYDNMVDVAVVETGDGAGVADISLVLETGTVMRSIEDRERLAKTVVDALAKQL